MVESISSTSPRALTGMTLGSAVMFVFGIFWFLAGFSGGRFFPAWMRVGVPLLGVVLAIWLAVMAVRVARISRNAPPPSAEQAALGRQIGRRFGRIHAIQWGSIVAAIAVLNIVHLPNFIAPAVAVIVALHFFTLAALFQRPSYNVTGILGCAIGLGGALISSPSARLSAVGLSFGLLLWLTVADALVGISRAARAQREENRP